ncbi:MAG TPA: dienelactone hydrolase family protein [Dehalococcoidales bacterium]
MNRDQSSAEECPVLMKLSGVSLEGSLCVPPGAKGIVIFAHGSGSSRLSPRNRYVAGVLQKKGIGTLLFDLLTAQEEAIDDRTAELRFNIDFLAKRLTAATQWLAKNQQAEGLKLGYFGASTGAAAALVSAAALPKLVQAVVSRGGRPDLAEEALPEVKAPTLLIVGGEDFQVIEMNRTALGRLKSEKTMLIVPGATHLFEEPGALEEVARLAADWFSRYLGK